LTVIIFHLRLSNDDGVAVGTRGVISSWSLVIGSSIMVEGEREGVFGITVETPEDIGRKREAKTPNKVPNKTRARPESKVFKSEGFGEVSSIRFGAGGYVEGTFDGGVSKEICEGVIKNSLGEAVWSSPHDWGGV